MVREVVTVERVAPNFVELGRIPSVAAHQRDVQLELFSLTNHQTYLGVISWQENRVRLFGFDRGQLGLEVDVAATVTLHDQHFATAGFKSLNEKLGKAHA